MTQCNLENLAQLLSDHLDLDGKLAVMEHLEECETCRTAFYQLSLDALRPEIRIVQLVAPAIAQVIIKQLNPLLRQEGVHMDAIRDKVHRIFFRLNLRPVLGANFRRNTTMDARNAVVVARAMPGQGSHVEIWAAAGTPNAVFKLTPSDLVKMTDGRIISIK